MRDVRDRAARTAATSLEAIETWARRTFYAAVAAVVCAGWAAILTGYGAWQYYRVTSAMANYGEHARSVMNDPEVKASQASLEQSRAKLQATLNGTGR